MGSTIKLLLAAAVSGIAIAIAIYICSIVNHQQPISSSLLAFHTKADAVMTKFEDHIFQTDELIPKALLEEIKAVNKEFTRWIKEMGCLPEVKRLDCVHLVLADTLSGLGIFMAEQKQIERELEQIFAEMEQTSVQKTGVKKDSV